MSPEPWRPDGVKGSARSTGCHGRVQDQMLGRHQKSTSRSGTGLHRATRDGTATSRNGPRRYTRGAGVRIDTEEVTGSIPVSPTTNGLVRGSMRRFSPGRSSLLECLRLRTLEGAVHGLRTVVEDGADLLAVDELGNRSATVAHESGICSTGTPLSDRSETKLCRSSRGVQSLPVRPAVCVALLGGVAATDRVLPRRPAPTNPWRAAGGAG